MNLLHINKRKSERFACQASACIQQKGSLICGPTTIDISAGGTLLCSPIYWPKNQSIILDLHLRSTDQFQGLEGEVLRSVRFDNGSRHLLAVKFDRLQPRLGDAAALEAVIQKFEKRRL